MQTPLDPLVVEMLTLLDDHLREDFEERAGIIEFDGKQPRSHAESLALLDVLRRHPYVLTGVTVLQIKGREGTHYALATDPDRARQLLADLGGIVLAIRDLADVIGEQYGGIALLQATRPKHPGRSS